MFTFGQNSSTEMQMTHCQLLLMMVLVAAKDGANSSLV